MREETGWESREKGISFPSTPQLHLPSFPAALGAILFLAGFYKISMSHFFFRSLGGISVCHSAPKCHEEQAG